MKTDRERLQYLLDAAGQCLLKPPMIEDFDHLQSAFCEHVSVRDATGWLVEAAKTVVSEWQKNTRGRALAAPECLVNDAVSNLRRAEAIASCVLGPPLEEVTNSGE